MHEWLAGTKVIAFIFNESTDVHHIDHDATGVFDGNRWATQVWLMFNVCSKYGHFFGINLKFNLQGGISSLRFSIKSHELRVLSS